MQCGDKLLPIYPIQDSYICSKTAFRVIAAAFECSVAALPDDEIAAAAGTFVDCGQVFFFFQVLLDIGHMFFGLPFPFLFILYIQPGQELPDFLSLGVRDRIIPGRIFYD